MIIDTLSYIGKKLNEAGVLWGVGASILLNYYGLIDKPNDIDILVDVKDIEKVDRILKGLGEKKVGEEVGTYSTEYFYEYVIKDIDVDVMAGLTINHSEGQYRQIFDCYSIGDNWNIEGESIPMTSLEDWYVIYQLIPFRENKVKIIESYLIENGIKKHNLLIRALKEDLPYSVKNNIKKLLLS